jgi:hypothetical protein
MKTESEVIENIQFIEYDIESFKKEKLECEQKIKALDNLINSSQAFIHGLKWCLNEEKEIINTKGEKPIKQEKKP